MFPYVDKKAHGRKLVVLRTLIKRKDLIKCKESCSWVEQTSDIDASVFIRKICFL